MSVQFLEYSDLVNIDPCSLTLLVRTGLGISFKTILVAKDPRMVVFSRAHARTHNTIDMEHIEKYCTIMTSNWYQLNQLNDVTNAPYIMLTKDELFQNQKRSVFRCKQSN